jgi:hypothetical protein
MRVLQTLATRFAALDRTSSHAESCTQCSKAQIPACVRAHACVGMHASVVGARGGMCVCVRVRERVRLRVLGGFWRAPLMEAA